MLDADVSEGSLMVHPLSWMVHRVSCNVSCSCSVPITPKEKAGAEAPAVRSQLDIHLVVVRDDAVPVGEGLAIGLARSRLLEEAHASEGFFLAQLTQDVEVREQVIRVAVVLTDDVLDGAVLKGTAKKAICHDTLDLNVLISTGAFPMPMYSRGL